MCSTFKVCRHFMCTYCTLALLSPALANNPLLLPPTYAPLFRTPACESLPAGTRRLLLAGWGGTRELNLYHPSYRLPNISGVQHFTRDRREESMSMGQKAPPGTAPHNCSARGYDRGKVFTRRKVRARKAGWQSNVSICRYQEVDCK